MTRIDETGLTYQVYFGWKVHEHLVKKQRSLSNAIKSHVLFKYVWFIAAFFRQFAKFVNIYFLVITLLAFVPDSPKSPWVSAGTLLVLMVA